MSKKGILVDMHFCSGCHACEIACKQENEFNVGEWGIRINEMITNIPGSDTDRVHFDYIPYFSPQCNLCAERISSGEDTKPSCVKHCGTACMKYGDLDELAEDLKNTPRGILYSPL